MLHGNVPGKQHGDPSIVLAERERKDTAKNQTAVFQLGAREVIS